MDWKEEMITKIEFDPIENRKEKETIAKKITEKIKEGQVIGFGSGSTSYLTVLEIAKKMKKDKINITAIPTSLEIKMLCMCLGIPTTSLLKRNRLEFLMVPMKWITTTG